MKKWVFVDHAILLAAFVTSSAVLGYAQDSTGPRATRTIWQGVFTTEQAVRGENSYQTNCNRRHGAISSKTPWIGLDDLMDHWSEDTAESFFNFLRTSMPPQRGRTPRPALSDNTYVDVISYILKANGASAGASELNAESLQSVRIEGRDGPKPLPHGALAIVVGCLQRVNETTWTVSMGTEPVRTRSNEVTEAELKAARTIPLGALTFRLQNVEIVGDTFDPAMQEGRRIQVKGYLIRQPNAERIDVRSIVEAGDRCPN